MLSMTSLGLSEAVSANQQMWRIWFRAIGKPVLADFFIMVLLRFAKIYRLNNFTLHFDSSLFVVS